MNTWKILFCLNEDGVDIRKYLYVTQQNTSTNPPTVKAGISGVKNPNDPEQYENIFRKLSRYSTALPQNWELFAQISIDNIKDKSLKEIENDFFKCIEHEGGERIKNKELFKDISGSSLMKAIELFIDSNGGKDKIKVLFNTKNNLKENNYTKMKKKYTKKQILESIKYWEEQLKIGNYKKIDEARHDGRWIPIHPARRNATDRKTIFYLGVDETDNFSNYGGYIMSNGQLTNGASNADFSNASRTIDPETLKKMIDKAVLRYGKDKYIFVFKEEYTYGMQTHKSHARPSVIDIWYPNGQYWRYGLSHVNALA